MKPKKLPTIEEYYELRLQQVVVESYPQRRWNRSAADRQGALNAGSADLSGARVCKSTTTRH